MDASDSFYQTTSVHLLCFLPCSAALSSPSNCILCSARLVFYGREDICVCVSVCTRVCVYFKYYYYYQHAIHLKAPSKLEPSRGAVGNDLPTRQWLVRRFAHKAASFGGLFACLVAFLIFGAGSLSHVVRNAANCSF